MSRITGKRNAHGKATTMNRVNKAACLAAALTVVNTMIAGQITLWAVLPSLMATGVGCFAIWRWAEDETLDQERDRVKQVERMRRAKITQEPGDIFDQYRDSGIAPRMKMRPLPADSRAALVRRAEQLRIQALGAAISRSDWNAVEQAYASIRDEFDRRGGAGIG
jgi:hypothetical protein